ncbi:hypothetical protein KN815_01695 [Streptomyces sp. 4503]|uniref:Uncharacterized protein n=1 Tax=Streptomyces niphimycinicus TaxID=2842201 RepID=A0ABS6C7J9_9ACTN|nr:hypothetical protein [Streptomyces niphimycinicus]
MLAAVNASWIGMMSEVRRRTSASPIGVHSAAQCSSVSTSIRSRAAMPASQVRDVRGVVPGVEHDQDVRVSVVPLPGGDQPLDDLAQLGGGHGGEVGVSRVPESQEGT